MTTIENLKIALGHIEIYQFRAESDDATRNAQRNLSGRSYYADENTLRGFKARISECKVICDGLQLIIVESIPSASGKRGWRFVCFDVFGGVVNSSERKEFYSSSKSAIKALWRFVESFDIVKHTEGKLLERIARMQRNSANALSAMLGF